MKTFKILANIFFLMAFLFLGIQTTFSQEFVRTLKGHTYKINSLSFSPDGKYIISGSWDETLKLWDASSGDEVRTFKGYEYRVNAVAYSPDGEFVASGTSDNTFKLWRIATGEIIRVYNAHKDNVLALAFSPDGAYIVSGSADNTLRLWDRREGSKERKYKGHTDYVNDVDFSPNGEYFASASDDKTIKIWDIDKKYSIETLEGHTNFVTDVEFSPDGRYLISASSDKTLILWDVASGDTIRTFKGHTNRINAVTFSPEGTYIASAGADTTVKIWETEKGRLLGTFTGHTAPINCLAFNPSSGKHVVSGSDDNTLKLWDYSNLLIAYSGYEKKVADDREMSNLFGPKDEFETLTQYNERLKQAEQFTIDMYEKYRGLEDDSLAQIALEEQRRQDAEELAKRLREEQDSIARSMRENELLAIELEKAEKEELTRRENIKKSFEKIDLKIDELGYYNAEAQYFPVTIGGKLEYVKIPIEAARGFKQNLQDVEIIGDKQLLDDCMTFDIFNIQIIHPITGASYSFGKQKKALYLDDRDMNDISLYNTNDNERNKQEDENWEDEENMNDTTNVQDSLDIDSEVEQEIASVKEDELFKVEYKFLEPSGDNILNAKEEGNLEITITNKSEIVLKKLKIKLTSEDAPKGLKYDRAVIFKELPAGETNARIFKLKASKKIDEGTFNFAVTFSEKDDNIPEAFTFTITTSSAEATPISTSEDESVKDEDVEDEKEKIEKKDGEETEDEGDTETPTEDKKIVLNLQIIEFIDKGKDNVLEAKEEGKLIVTISNTSSSIIKKAKLLIEVENAPEGLKFKKSITIKKILVSGSRTEKIIFKANKKIISADLNIKISLEENPEFKAEPVNYEISTKAKE